MKETNQQGENKMNTNYTSIAFGFGGLDIFIDGEYIGAVWPQGAGWGISATTNKIYPFNSPSKDTAIATLIKANQA
jgi:hypothetical protein